MTEATLNSAFVLCLDYTMDLLHFNVIKIVAGNVFFFLMVHVLNGNLIVTSVLTVCLFFLRCRCQFDPGHPRESNQAGC